MVVEPSVSLFEDIGVENNQVYIYSYTDGDQGFFLNSYYPDFHKCTHLFEPEVSSEVRKSRPAPKMEWDSVHFTNADVGLFTTLNP